MRRNRMTGNKSVSKPTEVAEKKAVKKKVAKKKVAKKAATKK